MTGTSGRRKVDMLALCDASGRLNRVGGTIDRMAQTTKTGEPLEEADVTAAMAELRDVLSRLRVAIEDGP